MPAPSMSAQQQLDQAAANSAPLETRFALLILNAGARPLPLHLFKAPRACLELAELLLRHASTPDHLASLIAPRSAEALDALLQWLGQTDAERRPQRFALLLDCMRIVSNLSHQQAERLKSYADCLGEATAHQHIAHAVEQAQQAGKSVADAARQARREVLRSHPDLRGIR